MKENQIENNKSELIIINRYEVEEALAKILFYIKVSMLYKPYEEYKEYFKELLKIVDKWIKYFVENNDLLKMSEKEVLKAKKIISKIPFDAYDGIYFEEIVNWLDIVIYYGSCPIGKKINENSIIRKDKRYK
ncbi:MAG: hypothetical protein IJD92_01775 [Bacilli bacterium]|nr:hypothetical protein [Bacilli bacterium]